jgi:hypothetical protein
MEIVAENIRAVQVLHGAAILEEMGMFAVADRIVEQFLTGLLPLGPGPAAEKLDRYWKGQSLRLNEAERRLLYRRVLGMGPGGDSDPTANREFADLWLRFVAAVSELARQPGPGALDKARKARLDLAGNLSVHGWGGTALAAARLANEVRDAVDPLSDTEIQQAYGARDMWQLVERVDHLYLGIPANVSRQRARLEAGKRILDWLADSAATAEPDLADKSLVEAVESWLAVHGEPEETRRPRSREIRAEAVRQVETLFARSRTASRLPAATRTRLLRHAAEIGAAIAKARSKAAGDLLPQVGFPPFVANLIEGTFDAMVDASVRQMEAYTDLLSSVASSLDRFVDDAKREPGRDGATTLAETLLAGATRIVIGDGRMKPCVGPPLQKKGRR